MVRLGKFAAVNKNVDARVGHVTSLGDSYTFVNKKVVIFLANSMI
jgi:hypothetical protein